ncbi:uncharacterized protein EAE97_003777 [Botrytis byssoidea]|uniref:Uncharacterized protein n=1 Tax=Botrytis byssoidea TaxID=139641 RepID=A0A9P5IT45_9HELO|nr:uncharacterized protein EAE97_003777 [Botrytis byssoidea]KAF7948366.1 hypothetical protein EAE97_003777 [Botrytis byssoidea]
MLHNSASQRDRYGRTSRPTTKSSAAKRGRRDSSVEPSSSDEMSDLDSELIGRNLDPNASIREYFKKKDEALSRRGPPPNRHGNFLEDEDLASYGILGEKLQKKLQNERYLEEEKEREEEEARARAFAHRERTLPGTNRKSAPAHSEPKTHHPAPPSTDASHIAAAPRKIGTPARGKESEDNTIAAMSVLNLSGNSSKEPVSNKAGKVREPNAQVRDSTASQALRSKSNYPGCYKVARDVHYKLIPYDDKRARKELQGRSRFVCQLSRRCKYIAFENEGDAIKHMETHLDDVCNFIGSRDDRLKHRDTCPHHVGHERKKNYDNAKARKSRKEADGGSPNTAKKAGSSGAHGKPSGDHTDSKRKRPAGGSG